MSGILFPNLVGTLAPLMQNSRMAEQNAFQRDRIRRADELDAEDRETGKFLGPALQGDKDAQARLLSSPKYAGTMLQHLDRLDTNQRARVKETSDWTRQAAMGVLNMPEAERPAAYQAALLEGQKLGYKIDMPPSYDRAVEGRLRQVIAQGMSVKDWHDLQNRGPQAMPPPGGGAMPPSAAPAGPDGSVISRASAASKGIESGGRYDAIGPIANKAGNRAYGAHQVMDFNIGPWTQEVLGQAMTPQQFLANPQAQDAVYKAKMGQYIQKYGSPEAASRAWFAGEGGMNNPGAKDVLGTSVQAYGQKFAQAYGDGAMGSQPTIANAAPMPGGSGAPPGMAVGDTRPQADASGNPLPPPAQAPGAAGGIDIAGLRKQISAGGGDLFTDPKTGQAEMQNGYYVVRSTQNPRQIIRLIPAPKPKEAGSGPFTGTGMDQQAMNVLLTGDPASPEYALSYSHLSKARTTLDEQGRPVTIQPMDLSAVRKPAGLAAAPAAAGGGTTTTTPGGGTVTVGDSVAPKGPGQAEMAKLRTARAEAEQITSAASDFKKEWEKATPLERARSLTGANTPLNAAYNNFALLAKGDALFKLGVLNGPDLEIIRRTIPDPSTGKSIMTTQGDVTSSVDKVLSILNAGITATEKQLKIGQPAQPGATQPPAQGAPKPPADNAERGRLIFDAQKAIKEGRDPVAVRARLKELNIDPAELDAK